MLKVETELASEVLARDTLAQTESALLPRRQECEQTAEELTRVLAHLNEVSAESERRLVQIQSLEKTNQDKTEIIALLRICCDERVAEIAALKQLAGDQAKLIAQMESRDSEQAEENARLNQRVSEQDEFMRDLDKNQLGHLAETSELKEQLVHLENTRARMMEGRERLIAEIDTLKRTVSEKNRANALLEIKQREHLVENALLLELVTDRETMMRKEASRAIAIQERAAKEFAALLNASTWAVLPRPFRSRQKMAILKRLGVFDRDWYLKQYADVRSTGIDPLRHYVEYGAGEGRQPNSGQ